MGMGVSAVSSRLQERDAFAVSLESTLAEAQTRVVLADSQRVHAEAKVADLLQEVQALKKEMDAQAKQSQELAFKLDMLEEDNDTLQQDNNLLKDHVDRVTLQGNAAATEAAEVLRCGCALCMRKGALHSGCLIPRTMGVTWSSW